jgi:predicted molibdopterin-dependent oxidoreductase YjgC
MTHWQMQPQWTNFPVDTSHSRFILDNNRCILCRRCIRACAEMSGNFTLGVEERGSATIVAPIAMCRSAKAPASPAVLASAPREHSLIIEVLICLDKT